MNLSPFLQLEKLVLTVVVIYSSKTHQILTVAL